MTEAEIFKIKEEATQKAVQLLEKKYNIDDIKAESYNEAIQDAQRYFILCGCRVLHDVFGFGRIRLERFLDNLAEMEVDTEEEITMLEALEKWLDEYAGIRLAKSDDDELKK